MTLSPRTSGRTLSSPCVHGPSSWITVMSERPLDCKEITPVSPKGFNLEYALEVLTLKLKLQYFGHLMWRADSLEKTLMLGKIEGGRRGRQRMRWLDGMNGSIDVSLSRLWEMVKDREAWHAVVHELTELDTNERLNNKFLYIVQEIDLNLFFKWLSS